jgi:fructose-1,6-bisphosphatase II / sedoheptulose-1,7-bisphosphatase
MKKPADAAAVECDARRLNIGFPSMAPSSLARVNATKRRCFIIGEKVGTGHRGRSIDIALDPLEGTTLTAKFGPNAMAVMAFAEEGNFLNAPDVYMDKIAVGANLPDGIVDLDVGPAENIRAVAKAKGIAPSEVTVCILDRPRHADLITTVRNAGARIKLISDGDVAGVIATSDVDTNVDMYMGSGGAPEGVLAAAALRCIGGQMQGRLLFRNDDEKARAAQWGITDLNRKYGLMDLAAGDVIFTATGVTEGSMLRGVTRISGGISTDFDRNAVTHRHGAPHPCPASLAENTLRRWMGQLFSVSIARSVGGAGDPGSKMKDWL